VVGDRRPHRGLPGAVNVIPANVVFTSISAPAHRSRAREVPAFRGEARAIADRRHLGLTITSTREVATTPCASGMQDAAGGERSARSAPSRCGSAPAPATTPRRWRSSARRHAVRALPRRHQPQPDAEFASPPTFARASRWARR
jgi:hypothetical protein